MKSLRSACLPVCLLIASFQAQAVHTFHQGFYAGGAFGASWGHAVWDGVSEISAVNNNGASLTIFESWTPSGESLTTVPLLTGLVGYQFIYQTLYLAAELGWTYTDEYEFDLYQAEFFETFFLTPLYTELVATAEVYNQATLGSTQFNLDLKPGWLFFDNRMLAYGRVGLAVNELSLESEGVWENLSSFFGTPSFLSTRGSSKKNETVYGIHLGLGLEALVTKNFGLILDYQYANFGSIMTRTNAAADGSSTGNQTHIIGLDAPEVTVSTQSLMLGLLYHW